MMATRRWGGAASKISCSSLTVSILLIGRSRSSLKCFTIEAGLFRPHFPLTARIQTHLKPSSPPFYVAPFTPPFRGCFSFVQAQWRSYHLPEVGADPTIAPSREERRDGRRCWFLKRSRALTRYWRRPQNFLDSSCSCSAWRYRVLFEIPRYLAASAWESQVSTDSLESAVKADGLLAI